MVELVWWRDCMSAEDWIAVLYQCGFNCFDCFASRPEMLFPVMRYTDIEDHMDLRVFAVCKKCAETYEDAQFIPKKNTEIMQ